MSSILKALKKLEEQKRSAAPDADRPRIVLDGGPPSRRKYGPFKSLLVIALLSAGAASGWFVWHMGSITDVAAPETVVETTEAAPSSVESQEDEIDAKQAVARAEETADQTAQQVVVENEKKSSTTKKRAVEPVNKPVPVAQPRKTAEPVTVAQKPLADKLETSLQLTDLESERVIEEVSFREEPMVVVDRRPAATTQPVAVTMPLMTVSEIYYHAEGGGSMAVINDLPVMEGTQLDGAMVERILPDRVRLTFQGKPLEVLLKSNP
jgi:hypothetical protein